jgi:hypothetical protein
MATDKDVLTLIKDENRRSFNIDDVPNRDIDLFYSLFVVKLRELRDQGLVETLAELRNHRNAVIRVDIVGGINLELE